jgi:hypothetical protein
MLSPKRARRARTGRWRAPPARVARRGGHPGRKAAPTRRVSRAFSPVARRRAGRPSARPQKARVGSDSGTRKTRVFRRVGSGRRRGRNAGEKAVPMPAETGDCRPRPRGGGAAEREAVAWFLSGCAAPSSAHAPRAAPRTRKRGVNARVGPCPHGGGAGHGEGSPGEGENRPVLGAGCHAFAGNGRGPRGETEKTGKTAGSTGRFPVRHAHAARRRPRRVCAGVRRTRRFPPRRITEDNGYSQLTNALS